MATDQEVFEYLRKVFMFESDEKLKRYIGYYDVCGNYDDSQEDK